MSTEPVVVVRDPNLPGDPVVRDPNSNSPLPGPAGTPVAGLGPNVPGRPTKVLHYITIKDYYGREYIVQGYNKGAFTDDELRTFAGHPAEVAFKRELKAASDKAQAPARAKKAAEDRERVRLTPKPVKPVVVG
jgi:hypothetical protein